MDFSWSEDQLELKESIIKFAQSKLNKGLIEKDKNCQFCKEDWKAVADFGLLGLCIPEKWGGLNIDFLTAMLVMEGLGYACSNNGFVFAINNHIWVCEIPILFWGNADQKNHYLPKLTSGEFIGCYGVTEPDSGSDIFSMRTRAELKGDKYILNGSKTFVTNAPISDVFIVLAVTDKNKKLGGLSAFIIERNFPGFSVSKEFDKMGLRTSPMSECIFSDCEVPKENLLGKEGSGQKIFNFAMEWERSFIFASHLGTMQRNMETCLKYAKDRKQFGIPIGKNQSISHKISDMRLNIELGRLLLYKIGWMKNNNKSTFFESTLSKLFISESLTKNCLDSLHIHGASGYMTEYQLERELRDSISSTIYSGTSEIQRNIIAQWMGL